MFKTIIATTALLFAGLASAAVNLNTASAEQLAAEIDGVGPVIAQRIVEHRETVGSFSDPAELHQVKGIGDRILEKNQDALRVE